MSFNATFSYELVDKYTAKLKVMREATKRFRKEVNGGSKDLKRLKERFSSFNSKVRTSSKVLNTNTARLKASNISFTRFLVKLRRGNNSLSEFGGRVGKLSTRLANLRTGFAATMLAMGLKSEVSVSADFEQSMNKVEAITQANTKQMKQMRVAARELGLNTRYSSIQAAEGMAVLGQRGYKTAEILTLLPNVLTMATAGNIEMSEASLMLTGIMKATGMGISQAGRVVDVFAITAANTASDMVDLNNALVNMAPLGHAAGMSFEEMAALVGALSDKNIRGSKSGTLLMNSFRNLIGPSNKAIKALKEFGFSKDEVTTASGQLVDFTKLLDLFEKRGVGVGALFRIFQIRGAKAAAALRGQVPTIRRLVQLYKEQAGAGKLMSDIMNKGIVKALFEASSAWTEMKKTMGKALEPIVIRLASAIDTFATFISDRPKLAKFIGVFMGISAAMLSIVTILGVLLAVVSATSIAISIFGTAVLGATTAGTGGFIAMAAAEAVALWPITLIVIALIAVVAAVIYFWDWIKRLVVIFYKLNIPLRLVVLSFKLAYQKIVQLTGGFGKMGSGIMSFGKKLLKWLIWPLQKAADISDWFMNKLEGLLGGGSELSATITAPDDLGTATSKFQVESNVSGSIDINDRTSGGAVKTAEGGDVPINLYNFGGDGGMVGAF